MSGVCINCGAALEDEAKFCPQCGAKVFVPTCPNCRAEIDPDATFCTQCGQPVSKTSSESHCRQDGSPTDNNREKTVYGETGRNEETNAAEEQAKAAQAEHDRQLHDFAYVIGKNTEYYLPEFEKAGRGGKVKFNWAAFLLVPMFCFYRKCGDLFIKFFLLPLIVENAGGIISLIGMAVLPFQSTVALVMMAGGVLSLLVGIVWLAINGIRFGLHFNELYYHHCCQLINSRDIKHCGTSVWHAILYAVVAYLIETMLGVILVVAMIPALLMGVQLSGTGLPSDENTPVFYDASESQSSSNVNNTESGSNDPFSNYTGDYEAMMFLKECWSWKWYYCVFFDYEKNIFNGQEMQNGDTFYITSTSMNGCAYSILNGYRTGDTYTYTVQISGSTFDIIITHYDDPYESDYSIQSDCTNKDFSFQAFREQDSNSTADSGGNSNDYLFPSDTQYISVSDLYDLSKDQVSLVLNEIYARHGCNFNSTNLRDYFNAQDWYYPEEGLNASNFDSSVLNDCEKENTATIVQYQKDQGWRS
ncbi:YARHG domain-containing protein [Oscillibacter ruminantium]